jgi:hypothetical protein
MRGVYLMTLSLINKIYKGTLFIWKDENYLLNEILLLNEDAKIVNARIVSSDGFILGLTCSYDEFLEGVVK